MATDRFERSEDRRFGAAIAAVAAIGAAVSCFGMPPPSALEARLDNPEIRLLQPHWRRLVVDPERRAHEPVERSGVAFDPDRGLVFVGTSQGRFIALESGMGRVVWERSETDPFHSVPVYLAEVNLVVVGNDGGVVLALDPATGREVWRATLSGPVRRPAAYADRVAYVRTAAAQVVAFEAETGKELWSYEWSMPEGYAAGGQAGLLHADGRIVTGFADGTVVALSAVSGDEIWKLNVAGEGGGDIVLDDVTVTPVRLEDVIVLASYDNGVFGLDPEEGVQRWARPDLAHVSGLAELRGDPLVAVAGVGLVRLDPADGATVWLRRFPAGTLSDPVVRDGLIVLSDDLNGLLFFEALDGRFLEGFAAGHGVAAPPAVLDDRLVYLDNAGELQAFYFLRPDVPAPD